MDVLRETIEMELVKVLDRLNMSMGGSLMCSLQKSNDVTQSMKYLEGQQQVLNTALRTLRTDDDPDKLLEFFEREREKDEYMIVTPIGQSEQWQAYLKGSLDALNRIQEIIDLAI